MHHAAPFTVATALRHGTALLQGLTEQPRRDVEVLLCAVLDRNRAFLFAHGDVVLDAAAQDLFNHYLQCRADGEPVAYIVGKREFWTLMLDVNDSTLIPRPDTELLVETALQLCLREQAAVLDLGTGTGAVALALASERPQWQIDAVDLREDAVALARCNAQRLGLSQVNIYASDWFSTVPSQRRFDLVVSNPPYIDADDPHLARGDVRFEPASALVAGEQGFADLFSIARLAPAFLAPGGWLALEHGWQQGRRVREHLCQLGYTAVQTVTDLAGHERVTAGQWLAQG